MILGFIQIYNISCVNFSWLFHEIQGVKLGIRQLKSKLHLEHGSLQWNLDRLIECASGRTCKSLNCMNWDQPHNHAMHVKSCAFRIFGTNAPGLVWEYNSVRKSLCGLNQEFCPGIDNTDWLTFPNSFFSSLRRIYVGNKYDYKRFWIFRFTNIIKNT